MWSILGRGKPGRTGTGGSEAYGLTLSTPLAHTYHLPLFPTYWLSFHGAYLLLMLRGMAQPPPSALLSPLLLQILSCYPGPPASSLLLPSKHLSLLVSKCLKRLNLPGLGCLADTDPSCQYFCGGGCGWGVGGSTSPSSPCLSLET